MFTLTKLTYATAVVKRKKRKHKYQDYKLQTQSKGQISMKPINRRELKHLQLNTI